MPATPKDRSPFEPLVHALESASILDAPATLVSRTVRAALSPGTVKDTLSGTQLGHPAHPAITDLVIGSFLSASLLDLLNPRGESAASERLIALGIAAYVPTAAAGLSDWIDGLVDTRVKRVGIAHAGANALALGLYGSSLVARRRGSRAKGVLLAGAGSTVLGVGAFLGGHLSFRLGIGPDQTVFDPGPEEWRRVADGSQLQPGRPLRVVAEETPILLLDDGDTLYAIHDRCSHRGCSLTEGEIEGHEVVCGCHFSRFDLRDGSLIRGPATAPQPAFEVRRLDGLIEVRRPPAD